MLRFLFIISLYYLIACQAQTSKDTSTPQNPLMIDFDTITTKKLSLYLKKNNYNKDSIYNFCQISNDTRTKIRLVSAIFHDAENYIQEGNKDYWAAILLSLNLFGDYIDLLKKEEHKTFLDVGSANGEKLFAALCLGFDKVYGIEYSPELVKISQKLLQNYSDKVEIKLHDALEVEGSYYQIPDFIYLYSPIRDNYKMARLYYKIMQNMKEGAILLEVRMVYINELRKLSHFDFPKDLDELILKKKGKEFYYFMYNSWYKLKKY